jgi:hypothetical protein
VRAASRPPEAVGSAHGCGRALDPREALELAGLAAQHDVAVLLLDVEEEPVRFERALDDFERGKPFAPRNRVDVLRARSDPSAMANPVPFSGSNDGPAGRGHNASGMGSPGRWYAATSTGACVGSGDSSPQPCSVVRRLGRCGSPRLEPARRVGVR